MMSPSQIDRTISCQLFVFLACVVCWMCGLVVSALMLGGLVAMSGSFGEWRSERGLWMLGTLFLFMFGGFSLLITYHQFADWFAGRAPLRGLMAADWLVGTMALGYKVRFLWAVTFWNHKIHSDP